MKGWYQCSVRERQLVDHMLQGFTIDEMVKRMKVSKSYISKRKLELKEAVAERMDMLDNQRVPQVEQVLEQISRVAMGMDLEQVITKDGDLVLKEVTTGNRLKALELLAKHYNLFTEKIEIEQKENVQIEVVRGRRGNANGT